MVVIRCFPKGLYNKSKIKLAHTLSINLNFLINIKINLDPD